MLEQLLRLLQSNYSLYVTFTGLEFWNVALVVFLIILTCLSYVLVRLKKKDYSPDRKEENQETTNSMDNY